MYASKTACIVSAFVIVAIVSINDAGLIAQKPSPVPVFITSAGAANGYTDPSKDNLDTVRDLWDEMKATRPSNEPKTGTAPRSCSPCWAVRPHKSRPVS